MTAKSSIVQLVSVAVFQFAVSIVDPSILNPTLRKGTQPLQEPASVLATLKVAKLATIEAQRLAAVT